MGLSIIQLTNKIIFTSLTLVYLLWNPHHLSAIETPDNFIIFTPPKTGTHLIINVLSFMFRKPPIITDQFKTLSEAWELLDTAKKHNAFLVSHSFTQEMLEDFIAKGYKVFFIIRDPRDQLISMMYWMRKGYWTDFQAAYIADQNEQIEELITGKLYGWKCYEGCIGSRLSIIENLNPANVFTTRYETLVGSDGGGSHELQISEISKIANFLSVEISQKEVETISKNIYGFGWSFREGKIGSWKKHFLQNHIELYKNSYTDLLIELGYETN